MPSQHLTSRPSSFLASYASLRVGDVCRSRGALCRLLPQSYVTSHLGRAAATAQTCHHRFFYTRPTDGTARPPSTTDAKDFDPTDVREPLQTPGWVSTHKTNGERKMSVSIRSGAQRQRARRPPNVPPQAPLPTPPPSLSDASPSRAASSSTSQQGEPGIAQVGSGVRNSALKAPIAGADVSGASSASAAMPDGSRVLCAVSSPASAPEAPTSQQKRASAPGATSTTTATAASANRSSPSRGDGTTNSSAHKTRTEPPSVSATTSGEAHPTTPSSSEASKASSHPLLYSVSRFTEPVKRIILIRNGRSEANDDVEAYVNTPDWRIPLVEEGKRESIAAGRALSELTGDDPVYFYYSPYIRSRQSLRYVLQGFDEARLTGRQHTREWWEEEEGEASFDSAAREALREGISRGGLPLEAQGIATIAAEEAGCNGGQVADAVSTDPTTDTASATFLHKDASLVLNQGTSDSIIGVREDVRLRDGDIGRYTTVEELMHHLLERERYGKFFYRFPYGESGADVCDRVTSFLDAFQRERVEFPMNTNVVIITHGLTMRMFIKRWFHLTVETFHRMKSPPPGSLCTLTRLHHRSCFRLDESCVESMHLPLSLNEYNGYKYRNKQLLGSMSSGAPYM